MIPSKLLLRNFMCYRDNVPALHFDGIQLACLCGGNGHGKSALIDAITWALWGKSRAKSDDDLIHLGQRDMEVEFDFQVEETRYRVIRKRTKARLDRPGQTLLEFQVAAQDGFTSISGDSLAQTQQKIIDTLHIDYPTFINSALLRQGHADEFTIKPPGERKKVLADILGLSYYDELEARAREYARTREQEQRAIQNTLDEIQKELDHRPEYETALAQIKETLAELNEQVEKQESEIAILGERKKALDFKQERLTELQKTAEQAKAESGRWQTRVKEHTRRITDYEKVLEQKPEVEGGYAQLQQVKQRSEELNAKLRESFALTKRQDQLVQAINEARGKKLEERGRLQSKAEQLEAKAGKIARLEEELAATRARLSSITSEEKELSQKKVQSQELTLRIQYLKSANARIGQQVVELEDKLALLAQGDARCPLCETELGAAGKQSIEEKYRADLNANMTTGHGYEAEMKVKESEHQEISRLISQLEPRIDRERVSNQGQIASLEKEIAQSKEAETELAKVQLHLARIEEQLTKEEFASAEQQKLSEVRQQLADLGYDTERHKQVRDLLAKLEKYEKLQRKLEEAERNLPSEKASLQQAEKATANWASTLKNAQEKEATLAEEITVLPELAQRLNDAEQACSASRKQQTAVRDKMVAMQERLARCSELENKRREKEQALLQTLKEKEVYEELSQAFGKRGVQVFLIEAALPELERETNDLLGRMTDGRMQVNIETQREAKRGSTSIETLDIRISDELGTRSYEMYSGGEAFRINLALRIALSKLLARRAGAPLPTLFIDEGFGTQDTSGLQKLVESINSIQDDFKKIIVITHLDELKDAFPVRIEVTKTGEGSTILLS